MILFDFECTSCGLIFEELVHKDKLIEDCPECGSPSSRMISAPRISLDPLSGDFPGATANWEKIRRSHHAKGSSNDWDYGERDKDKYGV